MGVVTDCSHPNTLIPLAYNQGPWFMPLACLERTPSEDSSKPSHLALTPRSVRVKSVKLFCQDDNLHVSYLTRFLDSEGLCGSSQHLVNVHRCRLGSSSNTRRPRNSDRLLDLRPTYDWAWNGLFGGQAASGFSIQ